ncbi:MAG: hypothetical protein LBD46_05505 [Endomicrobium sp.]|jgi:hypothetical protein|nr:hypothetical protein [Endomicrobium sp.]
MDNKKTTVMLIILLVILIVLMFLRACGMGPWYDKKDQDKNENIKPIESEVFTVKNDTNTVNISINEVTVGSNTVTAVIEEEIVKEEPKPKHEVLEPKPVVSKPVPKPAVKPKPKPKPISKSDLPKPAVQKPKKEVVTTPVFTNKSGFKPFYVYSEVGIKENHYSPYGMMGDISSLTIEQSSNENPHSGKTCIKVIYDPKGKSGWSGMYWTEPANNWGDKGFGFNLTGAERISFWARGEEGGEIISNFIMGGVQGKQYEDSDSRAIGPIELTSEWKQYFIYLEEADLSNIIGGFCFTITKSNNAMGAIFYLDDIVYE